MRSKGVSLKRLVRWSLNEKSELGGVASRFKEDDLFERHTLGWMMMLMHLMLMMRLMKAAAIKTKLKRKRADNTDDNMHMMRLQCTLIRWRSRESWVPSPNATGKEAWGICWETDERKGKGEGSEMKKGWRKNAAPKKKKNQNKKEKNARRNWAAHLTQKKKIPLF